MMKSFTSSLFVILLLSLYLVGHVSCLENLFLGPSVPGDTKAALTVSADKETLTCPNNCTGMFSIHVPTQPDFPAITVFQSVSSKCVLSSDHLTFTLGSSTNKQPVSISIAYRGQSPRIPLRGWHHIALSQGKSAVSLYIDGVLIENVAYSDAVYAEFNAPNTFITSTTWGQGAYIDDIQVFLGEIKHEQLIRELKDNPYDLTPFAIQALDTDNQTFTYWAVLPDLAYFFPFDSAIQDISGRKRMRVAVSGNLATFREVSELNVAPRPVPKALTTFNSAFEAKPYTQIAVRVTYEASGVSGPQVCDAAIKEPRDLDLTVKANLDCENKLSESLAHIPSQAEFLELDRFQARVLPVECQFDEKQGVRICTDTVKYIFPLNFDSQIKQQNEAKLGEHITQMGDVLQIVQGGGKPRSRVLNVQGGTDVRCC